MNLDISRTVRLVTGLALLLVFCAGVHVTAAQTGPAATQGKPFAVEYYYKVKWGFADEFIRLYKKNHHPLLKKQMEEGRIVSMKAETPFYHADESSRWDYRVTIVWKNSTIAHVDYDPSPHLKKLYPNREVFEREEQRRFEILISHWDVALLPVDLDKP